MKVLIACEESQTVCKAFRAKGHEAYSGCRFLSYQKENDYAKECSLQKMQ